MFAPQSGLGPSFYPPGADGELLFLTPLQSGCSRNLGEATGADYSKLGLRLDALAAFFQPRDCFANHAVAEMALRYAKQFRSRPLLLNFLDVCQTRDQIEFACHKEHAIRTAQWLIMGRRTEMKMPRHKRSLDVRPLELASYERRRGTFPNRVFDVHDRRHQGKKTKIALDDREQRADPAAVAGPEDAELATTALAQRRHQLPQFDHALTQPLCIADEIGGNRQFAVPVAARHPRIVIRQMHETRVPTEFVKAGCPAAIALVTRRHERVQHQYCRRAPAACAREKICASDVVRRKFGTDRTAPSDDRAVADLTRESAITRNSVKIMRRKFLAFSNISLKLIATARVQAVTRLHHVH